MPTAEDWYYKGIALDKASRSFEEAVECYDKALEIDPGYVEAWYGKGDALYLMARCYDRALNVNPKYVETWSRKGGALHIIGRCGSVLACLKEALRCFNQVLRLDPHHIAASGRKKQALKAINRLK